jgi:SAM-dependent methyltransferase
MTDVPTGNTYDKYGSTNAIEKRMMDGFFATFDGFVDRLRPQRILEVGVGEGEVAERVRARFPDATMVGLDLPDPELAGSWADTGLDAMFADATRLPFPDDSVDLVLAIEVFEHFDEPQAVLAEIARVCAGHLVASVPLEPIWRVGNMARGRYLRDWGNTPGHINHWGRAGFSKLIGTQFEVESVKTPLPWTMVSARAR